MKLSGLFKRLIIVLLVLCNFSCDQFSKSVVREKIEYYEVIRPFGNLLSLTKVENTGAFLSAGSSLPSLFRSVFLIILPLLFLIYGLYLVLTKNGLPLLILTGWCFVIGGGVGNLADRIIHGSVTDFLHLDLGVLQTGIFNFADVSIMAGLIMILGGFFLYPNHRITQKNRMKLL